MTLRRIAVLMVAAAMVLAACTSSGGTAAPGAGGGRASAAGCKVGVSWNNYQEERWAKWDEPAIKAALTAAGASTSRTTPSRRPRPRPPTSRT